MLSILNDTEKAVVETIRMRLSTEHALQYMKDNGFSISRATYFRHKKNLEEKKLERLCHMANIGFEYQHLDRIDGLELIEKKMWEEYNKEKGPWRRVQILKDIAQIQPYLASIYDSTKFVIEKKIIETKENSIIELNNKTTAITNNQKINNVPTISFNKETNTTIVDNKYDNVNDTSFIDKLISETTELELIEQLKKVKKSCVFY
ncbi:MAG TPA: hypothetical protein VHJ38_05750 [Nitrososphaeraceae archaeon]|jgi:hypothetical protein|nr:hypothetical protein [Nitrososphaeraceae archaeon]